MTLGAPDRGDSLRHASRLPPVEGGHHHRQGADDPWPLVLDARPPMLGTLAKMAPRPVPEMFAKFAKFAIFEPALEDPTLIHR